MNDKNIKKDILMISMFASLALSLVSTISYMIYTIINNGSFINHIISTLGVITLAGFAIFLVITGFFIENKKAKIFIIVASLLLTIYSISQVVLGINTPKEKLPDFTNYDLKEVINWANDKNIELIKEYKYNDEIEEFHIISQDIKEGTDLRKVKKLKITISNGIDKSIITKIDNMIGWNLDDVLKIIDDNKLTNVTINFEFSNTIEKDKIISQNIISEITRDQPIILVSSLGKESEQKSVVVENLVNMDIFHATVYLGRNNIKYSIVTEYDKDKNNIVLRQSLKPYSIVSANRKQEMVLTIAKNDEITIPDIYKMSIRQIDEWAANNHIIIEYEEKFDDTIREDKVITIDNTVGNTVSIGSKIKVTISKGTLRMIQFTDISTFEEWAKENDVTYNITYEFSDDIDKGKLITSTHRKNDIIRNDDTVEIVISKGGRTTIPNLIDKTLEEALKECKNSNIVCNYKYLDDNTSYTIITKQSMKPNSTVPSGTTIDLIIGK